MEIFKRYSWGWKEDNYRSSLEPTIKLDNIKAHSSAFQKKKSFFIGEFESCKGWDGAYWVW